MEKHSAFVLGIDCSTTACKAIIWDSAGLAIASGQRHYPLLNPEPDGYEQTAESYFDALKHSVRDAVAGFQGDVTQIAAMCITHQRETFVLTDNAGNALANAVVWMDARCRSGLQSMRETFGDDHLLKQTGKFPCTTPSIYKLLGLLKRQPMLLQHRPWVLDVQGYLLKKILDRFVTSLPSADPMGMVNMQSHTWDTEIRDYISPNGVQLPELVSVGKNLGKIPKVIADELGLHPDVVVIAGGGDGQVASLGAGLTVEHTENIRAYLNLGTAIVSGVVTDRFRTANEFRTLYGPVDHSYVLETDLKGGTFTLNWLAERILQSHADNTSEVLDRLEQKAQHIAPGCDGLVLVPYWNGVMNPYWDDNASGVMMGLRGHHGPEHIYRATLEGLAFEQRLHLDGVQSSLGQSIEQLIVLGGAAKSDLFCQIIADVTKREVVRSLTVEATCLGAAIIAMCAIGVFSSTKEATQHMCHQGKRFHPSVHAQRYEVLYTNIYRKIYPALRNIMQAT